MALVIRSSQRIGALGLALGLLAAGIWSAPTQTPGRAQKTKKTVEFNRDIRPILAKCTACHGHDPKQIRAGLNLTIRDSAISKLDCGQFAIVPFHPEKSSLVRRVFSDDPDSLMPPPATHKILSVDEKNLLRQWILEGAEYKPHWGFTKPVRLSAPAVRLKAWPKNAIDSFVLANLEDRGLHPSPYADRRTLIRRVSLDLSGLPPTPQEVNGFLADRSPNAYEKVVDRLLASPRYGERMAMDWMDYARYADSNGYQADYERYQYRWRDWVIDAFNKDMPYDEFTIEQLAGDLLPHPTLDQKIATGFCRNHRINTEGGVIPEEWRVETVIDRVETASDVWLGLTTGCARCHDHKYDPITQKEFYSLCAYFNNVPESGTGVEQPVNHRPLIKAPYPDQAAMMRDYQAKLALLSAEMTGRLRADSGRSVGWQPKTAVPKAPADALVARYKLGPQPTLAEGKGPAPKVSGQIGSEVGRSTGAVSTSDKGYVDLGDVASFDRSNAFSYALWINPKMGSGSPISRMDAGHDYRGWDLFIDGGKPAIHLISKWPADALKVISKTQVPNDHWSHVAVTYDGSAKAAGVRIYVDGKPTETTVEVDNLHGSTLTPVTAKIGRRTDQEAFTGQVDDLAFFKRALTGPEVANFANVNPAAALTAIPVDKRTDAQKKELGRLWALENDASFTKYSLENEKLAKAKDQLDSQITTVMIMEEMPKPRPAYVLIRGQYDHHGPTVTAGTPAFLPPLPAGVPNNRLGLAKWIVSPDNPLTARVTVNRLWERLFGMGIVATSEDFGTQSEFPSNPELLDWLATELHRLHWDLKAMLKEMVMTATYQQSSRLTPELEAIDPSNRLLARGPRFRLPAEVIRDQAMMFGNLLVEKIGGPSVRPYQPEGIWDETNVYGNLRNYKHDIGPNLHRRSLYTIWKRTAAPPNMTLFDVPARETCRVKRDRTDTPLQALDLMNDVTYIESARALAQRMIEEGGKTARSRLDYGFQLVLAREPSAAEQRVLLAGFEQRLQHYRKAPTAVSGLLAEGDFKNDASLDRPTVAAFTVAASTLLNLDETITKE